MRPLCGAQNTLWKTILEDKFPVFQGVWKTFLEEIPGRQILALEDSARQFFLSARNFGRSGNFATFFRKLF